MVKEYIERGAAIKDLEALCVDGKMIGDENHTFVDFADVINVIANQPTADVQKVRHGEWCHIDGDEWCCSYCGHIVSTEGSWEKPTKKYCSECGAKMDKE